MVWLYLHCKHVNIKISRPIKRILWSNKNSSKYRFKIYLHSPDSVFFSRHMCLIFIKFVYHSCNCVILLNLQGAYVLLTMYGAQHLVLFAHFYKVSFTCLLWFTNLHRLLSKLHRKQIFVSFFWLVVVFKVWNYWSQFLVTQWPFFTHKM